MKVLHSDHVAAPARIKSFHISAVLECQICPQIDGCGFNLRAELHCAVKERFNQALKSVKLLSLEVNTEVKARFSDCVLDKMGCELCLVVEFIVLDGEISLLK